VSWPFASFAIVIGVLLAGWLAYERSRPSARMVALVGTLAALAALGRDAFVALPDVKPITAMTFVVGYALGPIPGFAVGAIGMLASNILLGEGSYTPWQMAAWGIVGLAGAALGALTARRAGRVTIALGCCLSAIVAKETMNLYTWTLGASHTPAALIATVGAALSFDVTDAVASLLFGLAFGPQLARLLARTRARMSVTWESAAASLAVLAAAGAVGAMLASGPGTARASAPARARASGRASARAARANVSQEVAFLISAQNADGGFGGTPGLRTSELYSAWAALGLAAAGIDPARTARGGHTVLDAIRGQAATIEGAGDLERTILALRACGAPATLAGHGDLVDALLRFRASDGSFEDLVNITSFAVLALRAAGRAADDPLVHDAASWLARQQGAGGGFGYAARGGAADVDDTGAAIQALVAAGDAISPAVARAAAYLENAVDRDGGLPQQPGAESNAQSTAWAIQGLLAAGRNPAKAPRGARRSPLAYLEGLRMSDGSVRYSRTVVQTPVWVTAQALTALVGKVLPIDPPPARGSLPRSHVRGVLPTDSSPASAARGPSSASRGSPVHPAHPVRRSPGAPVTRTSLDALARAAGALLGLVLG
jgi:energy-coupling factor transport system substrate-specific component